MSSKPVQPEKNLDGKDIGKRVLWLRRMHNMSQKQVAKYVGVTYQAVGNWEHGRDYPTAPVVLKLADFFGVGFRDLIEGFPASHPLRFNFASYQDETVIPVTHPSSHSKLESSGNIVKPKKQRNVRGEINVKRSKGHQPRGVAQQQTRRNKTKKHK